MPDDPTVESHPNECAKSSAPGRTVTIATPPRLIAIQQATPCVRDVFERASAASALHGDTTRSTLNPAPVSGASSGLTVGSLRLAPSGSPHTTARLWRGSRN